MDIRSHMDKYIDENTKEDSKVGVFVSGGIDSAIVLEGLKNCWCAKTLDIHAYTLNFNNQGCRDAAQVADYFRVQHKIFHLTPDEYLHELPTILETFPRPRYNVWPYWLFKMASQDECEQVWMGEGCDELFGYPDRDFLEGWAGQLIYIYPTYLRLAGSFSLPLYAPFMHIQDNIGEQYARFYNPPNKMRLREAYDGILPPEILLRPASPPDFINYDRFFGRLNAKEWLHKHTIKTWLEVHK